MARIKREAADTRPSPPSAYSAASIEEVTAIIAGVDAVAHEMEREWGIDRLPLLVGDDLRMRFRRQQTKWNDAVWTGGLHDVRVHGGGMRRAWQAIDQAARTRGRKPLDPKVFEVRIHDNRVAAIVASKYDVTDALGRYVEVWTVEELAKLISAHATVGAVKETFPGAFVSEVRAKSELDDEIPY